MKSNSFNTLVNIFNSLNFSDAFHGSLKKIYRDPLEGIDIKKEYMIIKRKESNLSANMRDLIVYRYEKQLKEENIMLDNNLNF